jgi:hypothetical protein
LASLLGKNQLYKPGRIFFYCFRYKFKIFPNCFTSKPEVMKIATITKLNAKIAISVAVVGAIISIAFVKPPQAKNDALVPKKKVEKPFRDVDVEYSVYHVSTDKAAVLKYKTGSVINIPAGAFVDSKGKPITGKVELKYREFHDPADFFISGIPMTYDSAGTEYHFESAGMLEILAFQGQEPVFVNPDKKIVVEMASKQPDDKYNIYQFDSLAGNWKFIYKDKAGEKKAAIVEAKKTIQKVLPTTQVILSSEKTDEPVKPSLMDKRNYHFNLEVDLAEFPEISVYKDILFEVKEEEADFNQEYASRSWEDVMLEKNNKGSYLMTLAAGTESHTFEVMPVFDATSYEAAYAKYSTLLSGRKEKEAITSRKNDSIRSLLEKERKFQYELAMNNLKFEAGRMETQNIVQRVFVISGFGIWNSDCPAKLPQGEQFAATYTDSTGKKLQFKTLYLVEKGRNAMFAITSYSRLYYDPSKKNILWAVTTDNKMAILKEEGFKDLKKKNDSCVVSMTIVDKQITKAYEVKEILNF